MTGSAHLAEETAGPTVASNKVRERWWYVRWGAVVATIIGAVAAVAAGNLVGGAVLVLAIAGITPILKPNFGRRDGFGALALYLGALGPFFWGFGAAGDPPAAVTFYFAVGAAVATTIIYWVGWSRTSG